jgi:hypothetical protein
MLRARWGGREFGGANCRNGARKTGEATASPRRGVARPRAARRLVVGGNPPRLYLPPDTEMTQEATNATKDERITRSIPHPGYTPEGLRTGMRSRRNMEYQK